MPRGGLLPLLAAIESRRPGRPATGPFGVFSARHRRTAIVRCKHESDRNAPSRRAASSPGADESHILKGAAPTVGSLGRDEPMASDRRWPANSPTPTG